jgi:hypothetical protein
MRTQKRFLITLAALAAAGLAGCLNSPDSASSLSAPVTESEIQAALSGDSLHPAPPPRPIVCDTLKARLAASDSTVPDFARLSDAVAHVCAVRPDSGAVRPPRPLPPKGDSLRPLPPKPPRPDSAVADSLRPLPPKPPKGKGPAPKPPKK